MADAVQGFLPNGYVNVCGAVLSLLPELGAEGNAAPVLQAMEIHGTWILPYNAAKIPSLWEDFVSTLAENTRRYLRDEDDQSEEEETPSGKITWELRCKRADDGWLSALMVQPYGWRKRYDGQLEREYVRIENLLSDVGKDKLKDGDVRLATLILSRELDRNWYRGKRGVPEALSLLCGMDNVELVIVTQDGTWNGKEIDRRNVRIKERRCDMRTGPTN